MSATPPRKDAVFQCLEQIWSLLFPDHLPCRSQAGLGEFKAALREEVGRALTFGPGGASADEVVDDFLTLLPALRQKLLRDAEAAVTRDPSAHSVDEVMSISDYVYIISDARIVDQGTPAQIRASSLDWTQQFLRGAPDGPVPFHYKAREYSEELLEVSA